MIELTYRSYKNRAIQIYAFENNRQVGCIKVIDLTEPAAYIPHLNIRMSHRRKGYGMLLLNQIKKLCIDNDCTAMSLYVDVTNEPAIALYKKFGFFIGLRTNRKKRHYLMVKKL